MVPALDVVDRLEHGTKVKIFYLKDGTEIGVFEVLQIWAANKMMSVIRWKDGANFFMGLGEIGVEFDPCEHEWKRLDLFRTTEFHCKLCSPVRPFDIEKDEAS